MRITSSMFHSILKKLPLRGMGGFVVAVFFALAGCSDDFTFTNYPCYLVIDNSTHQDPTLMSAMNAVAPGTFCIIVDNESAKKFEFRNNQGLTSAVRFDQKDEYRTRAVGMNNAVIVGYGTFTGQFHAYDRECPVCFDPSAIPVRSKPLTISGDGIATCSVCHRRWDMNNGGNYVGTAEGGKDEKGGVKNLTRYRAGTTGPYGVLSVGN